MSTVTVDHRRHVIVGTDTPGHYEEVYTDANGNLQVRNLIYNIGDMDWEAATGSLGAGGAVEVTNFPTTYPDPLGPYKITSLATSSTPMYFGFVDKSGNWYIMKLDIDNGTSFYCAGISDYATYWERRAELSYDYLFNVHWSQNPTPPLSGVYLTTDEGLELTTDDGKILIP